MRRLVAGLAVALTACAGEPEPIILETPRASATAPATVPIDPAPTEQPTRAPILTTAPATAVPSSPMPHHQLPKININTADEVTLALLPRIGPALARRIIDHRQQHGPFKTIENLKDVRGIGDAIFEAVKDLIVVQ